MANPVLMPRTGQTVESCLLTKWYKKVGDPVTQGEPLFSYETDKASFEEEAAFSGTLLAVFFAEDDDVPCLSNIAVIGEPGEDFAQFAPGTATLASAPAQAGPGAPGEAAAAPDVPQAAPSAAPAEAHGGMIKVSPRARAGRAAGGRL